jgi:hypothetical protein
MTVMGHKDRSGPLTLSAGCGFRKKTIAGMRRKGRDAPVPVVRGATIEPLESTRSSQS